MLDEWTAEAALEFQMRWPFQCCQHSLSPPTAVRLVPRALIGALAMISWNDALSDLVGGGGEGRLSPYDRRSTVSWRSTLLCFCLSSWTERQDAGQNWVIRQRRRVSDASGWVFAAPRSRLFVRKNNDWGGGEKIDISVGRLRSGAPLSRSLLLLHCARTRGSSVGFPARSIRAEGTDSRFEFFPIWRAVFGPCFFVCVALWRENRSGLDGTGLTCQRRPIFGPEVSERLLRANLPSAVPSIKLAMKVRRGLLYPRGEPRCAYCLGPPFVPVRGPNDNKIISKLDSVLMAWRIADANKRDSRFEPSDPQPFVLQAVSRGRTGIARFTSISCSNIRHKFNLIIGRISSHSGFSLEFQTISFPLLIDVYRFARICKNSRFNLRFRTNFLCQLIYIIWRSSFHERYSWLWLGVVSNVWRIMPRSGIITFRNGHGKGSTFFVSALLRIKISQSS